MLNQSSSPVTIPLDYVDRINRAIDHIVSNLGSPLKLDDVARAACLSPFHFHRVFRNVLGETLNDFVKRIRLERALQLMSHAPSRSLTEIALDCGFSTSSDFSRSFKKRFGVPPSVFDIRLMRDSRRREFDDHATKGDLQLSRLPQGENPDGFEVRMVDLPPRTVAYIRVLDPYRPEAVTGACERLLAWAEEREIADGQWLGYMWEDPEIVELKNCRYDAALVVDDVKPGGEIGRFDFPEMLVAEVAVRGDIQLEQRALDWLYGTWLPSSEYEPADHPCFESWIGKPFEHGFEHFELKLQLPVKRASA
ncbi:MAG TPA: AraC family transcriptional regulator [Xanthomonadales bacterium]|nr:AraC family transcriptional regulator [Xanthomonadales bacterium]